jgi:hypothetical protein
MPTMNAVGAAYAAPTHARRLDRRRTGAGTATGATGLSVVVITILRREKEGPTDAGPSFAVNSS